MFGVRRELLHRQRTGRATFRWRGSQVSRIEAFSDVVFGFALTLLVVSLQVPRTFDDLIAAMRGFVGFGVCFCLLSLVWYEHYIFFRRYGLEDGWTLVLNLVLLFLVVLYVYPLKFLFTLLVSIGMGGVPTVNGHSVIRGEQMPTLMMIYGAGFVAVQLVFVLLYRNALKQRRALDLSEVELFETRASLGSCLVLAGIGAASTALASGRTSTFMFASGGVWWLTGFAMFAYWKVAAKRRRRLEVASALVSAEHDGMPVVKAAEPVTAGAHDR